MPHGNSDPLEQFNTVEDLLTRWLKERRALLGRYTEIAVAMDNEPQESALRPRQAALCELLVDYVSAGHFEVFHQLVAEAERFDDGSGQLAEELIPDIGDTTEVILGFEEKYPLPEGDNADCAADLSLLGEVLESRFELEDRLIAGLHKAHAAVRG